MVTSRYKWKQTNKPLDCVWARSSLLPYIGISHLEHGCITMRQCIEYINDPNTTLIFDLMVNSIGILTCLCVRPVTFFCIDINIPYFAHGSITTRGFVAYIPDRYDADLWPHDQIYSFFLHDFVLGPKFLSVDRLYLTHECITISLNDVSHTFITTFMTFTFDFSRKFIFSPWICVWTLLFETGVPNNKWMCHHYSTSYVHTWPLWPLTYMWVAEVSLMNFTHIFILFNIWFI